jgi:aryl-alcohol dehydrogenase-like predicted oxidoreductase
MSMLPSREVGPFTVSAMGLGCMNLSHAYLPRPSADEAERLLLHALDAGVTFFDTAAIYGFGHNEELLGRTLMHRRDAFVLASKCVLTQVNGQRGIDGSAQAITATLDAALKRLRSDHIDLYYMHRLDPKVPVEESMGALVRAHEAGKIGAIGLSEMSAETIRRAHAVHPIAAVQTEYSLWTRNVEIAVLDTCEELDIGFVAFSPLGRGLLAGAIGGAEDLADGDLRKPMPRFHTPHVEANLRLFAQLAEIARELGGTAAQLALAWLLAKNPRIVPIPGTTSIAHLDEDLGALSLEVPAKVIARLDAIFTPSAISGARYTADAQAQVGTETWPDEPLA